jgi:glycosyltransferase involved in cell wall biosynthesis
MTRPCPVSVVLPVRNVARLLPRQLDALARQTIVDRLEIIIVDDASTDATVAAARQWCSTHTDVDARVVQRPRHNGPNAARNHGILLATTTIVLLCDGDDVVAPDWAEHLVAALEQHPDDQVLVSGRCVGLDAVDQPNDTTIHGEMLHRGTRYMLGGNGAFRRQLAFDIGGFDEQIYAGGTEIDFCFRAIDHGTRVLYVPEAVIGYRVPSTPVGIAMREFRRTRGYAYLARRHGERWASSRPIDVFVRPWKQCAATTAVVLLGRVPPKEFPLAVGRLVGSMLWGVRFVLHQPSPRLGLLPSHAQ